MYWTKSAWAWTWVVGTFRTVTGSAWSWEASAWVM